MLKQQKFPIINAFRMQTVSSKGHKINAVNIICSGTMLIALSCHAESQGNGQPSSKIHVIPLNILSYLRHRQYCTLRTPTVSRSFGQKAEAALTTHSWRHLLSGVGGRDDATLRVPASCARLNFFWPQFKHIVCKTVSTAVFVPLQNSLCHKYQQAVERHVRAQRCGLNAWRHLGQTTQAGHLSTNYQLPTRKKACMLKETKKNKTASE